MVTLEVKTSINQANERDLSSPLTILECLVNTET